MAATETPQSTPERDPVGPLPGRAWWHRHLAPQERRRIMSDLAISRTENWGYRFTVMLTLSVVVAVMGLALDSAAVVIGAMLLAPLMQPVLAAGACMSLALFTKSLQAMIRVLLATAWCIGVAYLISYILPEAPLTDEVLSRTQPDIKDLVVALAAGAAGAYATVREDVSASLPGVAVAVALVPPLASVGMALERADQELAIGALLLYITNLAAILFASIVVFVITGFVSPRRLSDNLLRLTLAGVALVALVVVIAVPLYRASIASIDRSNEQDTANAIVAAWLGDLDRTMEQTVTIKRDQQQVLVEIRGFETPPDQGTLIEDLRTEFPDYDVAVQWLRSQRPTTTTLPPPEPTEQLLAEIRVVVEEWLAAGTVSYQIDNILLDGSLVRIDAAGTGAPPTIDDLLPRLAEVDPSLQPGLNWATLETITEETVPSPLELTTEQMELVVEQWAAERLLVLRSFAYDGERAEVEIAGSREPDLTRLEELLADVAGEEVPLLVYFIQRQLVTTTLPTTTTIPASGVEDGLVLTTTTTAPTPGG
ncbi:MAG: TIGR00341 family protein [Actinomycetota bacterium]